MKNSTIASIIMLFMFMFMTGIWAVDISVGAMLTTNAEMTNGFWTRDPMVHYHLGLYIMIITFSCLMLLLINQKYKD